MVKRLNIYRVQKYFFIIIFPIAIILGNFQILMFNENFYLSLYKKSGTYGNFERENIVENATSNLLSYFRGQNKLDVNFYSKQAAFHLKDVKNLLDFSRGLFILTAFACFFIATYLIVKKKYLDLLNALFVGSLSTLILIVLLGTGFLNAFDWLFIKFHLLLFRNELWLFDETDNLIKLFPEEFFINFANQLAFNIFLSSATIAVISYLSLRGAKLRSNLKQPNNLAI